LPVADDGRDVAAIVVQLATYRDHLINGATLTQLAPRTDDSAMHEHGSLWSAVVWVAALAVGAVGCDGKMTAREGVDAASDAPVIAGPLAYDVAYISEFTFGSDVGIGGFLVVVNMGTEPIEIADIQILKFSDDSAQIGWEFEAIDHRPNLLPPHEAAGDLSPDAKTELVTGGIVTEPLAYHNLSFGMMFTGVPTTDVTVHATTTLEIKNRRIDVPFTVHFSPGVKTEFNATSRIGAL
jgi:hypothetical protein